MDILNDVMQFGLECFASKGLHGVGLELIVRVNSQVGAPSEL